jgi:hypothetical protein
MVKVGKQALTQTLKIGVSQIEVDLSLGAAGRFSFTVPNTFDLERRAFVSGLGTPVLDILTFGASVEVFLRIRRFFQTAEAARGRRHRNHHKLQRRRDARTGGLRLRPAVSDDARQAVAALD